MQAGKQEYHIIRASHCVKIFVGRSADDDGSGRWEIRGNWELWWW